MPAWASSMCISNGNFVFGFIPKRSRHERLPVVAHAAPGPRYGQILGKYDREVHGMALAGRFDQPPGEGSPTTAKARPSL